MADTGSLASRFPYQPAKSLKNFAAAVHKDQVCVAFGERSVPKLATLLTNAELGAEKRALALELLRDILSSQERKTRAVDSGVVESCTALVDGSRGGTAAVRALAAEVLSSLSTVLQGRRRFLGAGTLPVLAGTLAGDGNERRVRECATLALQNVARFRDGARSIAASESGRLVAQLVEGMLDGNVAGEPSPLVTLRVVTTLADVTQYSPGVEQALSAGVVPQLMRALALPGQSPALPLKAIVALWNVAQLPKGKKLAIAAGAVATIANVTRFADNSAPDYEEVLRCGAGALNALAINEKGKVAMQHADVVAALRSLVLGEGVSAEARKNAVSAIYAASEHPDVRRCYIRALVADGDALDTVFGTAAAHFLNDLLVDDDAGMRMHSSAALAAMTSATEEGREGAWHLLLVVKCCRRCAG